MATAGKSPDTPGFERLLEHLKQSRGFDFSAYKRSTLERRILKRMSAVGVASYDDYVDYLQVHPDEFAQLFNTILINVTAFFRDPATFDYLRTDIIPALLRARGSDGQIRLWTAGCSSGEECYSVAILLAEVLGADEFRTRVKLYATDIDEQDLGIARAATYTDRQMENVSDDLRAKYFDANGSRWSFKKELRRNVIFGRHDLLEDAPISRVDLLTCRNTLMYFNHEAQARIVSRFHFALREGGYLVLGRSEMLINFTGTFSAIDLKQRVFKKISGDDAPNPLLAGYPDTADEHTGASHRLREIALDQDPMAQLVLDARLHLLIASARARELFGLHPRDIGRPLQDLEMSYRPLELRSCIDDAHLRRQVVQVKEVSWPTRTGEIRHFNVQVIPIVDSLDATLGTKIIFEDITRERELQEELNRSRQELETAYEELQSTNEELETTNEELQSTVEELETTNEELQSTNEELETMNEELQSTNEELETLNEELRRRGMDLGRSNLFLNGILRSVPLGVVVLNHGLDVELWNDVATDLWGLRQDEVKGQQFLALDIGLPQDALRQPIHRLQQSSDSLIEVEVDAINRRGRPTRVRVTGTGAGRAGEQMRGIILLMQEVGS